MKQTIMEPEQIRALLLSLGAEETRFPAGTYMILQGEIQKKVCYLCRGKAHASRTDAEGREEDYALLGEGQFFGDVLALSDEQKSPVSVLADEECLVISFAYDTLLHSEKPDAKLLLHALFNSLTERFFRLQRRVGYLTRSSLREKITSYLSDMSRQAESDAFTIPLDRNALAAFLYCDRSALSRELSNMKKDGLIDYSGNHFVILHGHFSKKD